MAHSRDRALSQSLTVGQRWSADTTDYCIMVSDMLIGAVLSGDLGIFSAVSIRRKNITATCIPRVVSEVVRCPRTYRVRIFTHILGPVYGDPRER